ncbi:MAG: hypothetical protein J6A25_00795 [Lachnospiraceae bacterium]|nr:hypothetical protein [Lachnospiraceae bacterium]
MVIREFYLTREDGINLYRIYSDEGFEIQKVGTNEIYGESIDVEDAGFEYIETKTKISKINTEEEPTGGR